MICKAPTRCCRIWRQRALAAPRHALGPGEVEGRVCEPFLARGKSVVIPPKSNRKVQRDFDKDAYKARHLIENFFCKLKQYRAIATRYDKTAKNILAAIHLAAAIIWLN